LKNTIIRNLAGLALALSVAGSALAQAVLYGAIATTATTSSLLILNPATGALVSTVGPIGYAVTGLAVHPTTGVLYGSTSNNSAASPGSLITINKTTGAGTLVGSFGSANQTMADLTFTSDGTLYGWLEPSTDDLHTINLTTGAPTDTGDAGLSTYGAGLAAGPGDVLYFAGSGGSGPLRTINRTTGAPTTIATLTGSPAPAGESIAALAFNSTGTLYGVHIDTGPALKPTHLITINTTTGAITDLGSSVNQLDAIVFDGAGVAPAATVVPTLDTWGLIALAVLLAGAAFWTRRRRA
jgi:hypothetical protein